jgi:aryl-alcohol dehydrogenase-like predicted oxidoreductase
MIRVRYRINQKTQDKISEIGLGSAYMPQTPLKEAIPALRQAYEGGINYYDLAAGDGKAFPMYGEAFKDVRISILYQIHFGADYSKGTYKRRSCFFQG